MAIQLPDLMRKYTCTLGVWASVGLLIGSAMACRPHKVASTDVSKPTPLTSPVVFDDVTEADASDEPLENADTTEPTLSVLNTKPKTPPDQGLRPVALPPRLDVRNVLMVGGFSSLEALAGQIASLRPQVGSLRVLKAGILRSLHYEIRQELGLKHTRWLRSEGPIRVIVMAPVGTKPARAFVLPITTPKKVLAAIPAEKRRRVEGHAAILEVGKKIFYLDFMKGYAVLTSSQDGFKAVRKALDPALSRWVPQSPLVLHVDTKALSALYGNDMVRQRGVLLDSLVSGLGVERYPNFHPLLGHLIGSVLSSVTASSELNVSVHHLGQNLELSCTFRSDSRAFGDAFSKPSGEFAKHIRAGGWLMGSSNIKLPFSSTWYRIQHAATGVLADFLGLQSVDEAQFQSLIRESWENADGGAAFTAYESKSFPIALTGVRWVKQASEALKLDEKWFGLLARGATVRLLQLANKDANPPTKAAAKAGDVIGLLNDRMKKWGVTIAPVNKVSQGISLRGLDVAITWDKVPSSPLRNRLKSLVGSRVQIVMAYGGRRVGFAVGPQAIQEASLAVTRPQAAGNRALDITAKTHAFAVVAELGQVARILGKLVAPLSLLGRRLSGIPSDAVLSVNGKSDGPFAVFRVSVPASVIRALK